MTRSRETRVYVENGTYKRDLPQVKEGSTVRSTEVVPLPNS